MSTKQAPARCAQPLAIVGMSCRLPGGNDLQSYWDQIVHGRSALGELPPDRLDQRVYYDPEPGKIAKTYSNLGGLVHPYTGIKSRHRLTDAELRRADPAHLELLGTLEDAYADAGWHEDHLDQSSTGIYVGHTRGTGQIGDVVFRTLVGKTATWLKELPSFQALSPALQEECITSVIDQVRQKYPPRDRQFPPALEAYQASSILARAFGLSGPAMALNAACASSLIALNLAAQALRQGTIDTAIVGSGSYCKFDSLILFSKAGSVSGTGSRPFDASADGLISSEGYVILIVKTLAQALRDGDRIRAVVRGLGYSSDGKGKSLWAPREEGQILAIQRAYSNFLSPHRLQYVEAHATSTAVGDATEMNALVRALGPCVKPGTKIPIGSVKALIGHTLETAGLAGLVKAALAIEHRVIPPVDYVQEPNPKVDWNASPLRIPTTAETWAPLAPGIPRRAGVNAFGIGGMNAHVILDEYLPDFGDAYFRPDDECGPMSVAAPPAPQPEQREPIAIIGMGVIAPNGQTLDEFWQATLTGRSAISEAPADRVDPSIFSHPEQAPPTLRGGFLHNYAYDWRKHKVPPKQVANADPLQFMLLDAVDQALRDTGIAPQDLPTQTTGVIVGSVFGGEFGNALQMGIRLPEFCDFVTQHLSQSGLAPDTIAAICDSYQSLLLQRMPALLDETGSFSSSTLASRITKSFDLMGGGSAIDAGRASGLAAVELGIEALREGDADLMICAAGQRSCGQYAYDCLVSSNRLSATGTIDPLMTPGDGIVPGEGAAVVVLKRLSDALRDGNRVHAVLHDVAFHGGRDLQTAFANNAQQLLADKQRSQEEIQFVEVAACGDATSDAAEVAAIDKSFASPRPTALRLCDLKSQVGETYGVSGMLALIRAAKSLSTGQLPPAKEFASTSSATTNVEPSTNVKSRAIQRIDKPAVLFPLDAPRPAAAIVNAYCDTTFAASALLTNVVGVTASEAPAEVASQSSPLVASQPSIAAEVARPSRPAPGRVIRFAAPTVSELLFQLQSASEDSSFFTAQQQPPAANRSELFCLNIIAHSADEFAQKCQLATHALEQSQFSASMLAQGILFRKPLSGPALVACLFSGQGSSYPGMLLPWIEETQAIASAKNQWNEWLLSNGHPSLKELYADTDRQLGVDLLRTQLALLSSEALLFSALQQLNVRPDRVAGHSFGEYGALWAARCWDGPTAIAAATARAYSVTSSLSEPSSLLCAFCDSSTANTVCSDCDGHVYVANTNGRQQVVLGGKRDALKRAAQLLARLNVRVLELSVPFAFHTPELAPASPVLARHLDQLTLSPPHVPLLSSVTNLYEAEPSRLRDNLARQLTTPVHWTTLVERLVSEGVKLFIEVGPGRVLSSLGQRDFQQAEDLLFVPCDDAKKGPQNQLAIVEAAYDLFHCPAPTLPQTPIVVSTPQTQEKFEDQRVPLLELSGSPFEMGYTCGVALRDAMRPLLERMISIPRDTYGFPGKLSKVRLHSEQWFDDDARAEIAGLAAGCGVNVESVLALNLVLYPDIDAGCCHFVSQPEKSSLGQWLHGGNEDLPIGLLLGSALQRVVQLRRPAQGLRHVLFSAVGQVGALTGMNAAGLSVTSAMLLDRPLSPQNQAGFVHGVLVGKILAQADSLAKAEQICRETPHRGAWGLMVASAAEQRAIYLEFDGQQWASEPVAASRTAANHSELLGSLTDVPEHSVARGNRLRHLLASGSPSSDRFASACTALLDRFDATRGRSVRHKTMNTVCRVDHQASILMAPQVGKAWLAPGDAEELDDAIDSVPTNFIELDFQSFLAAEKVPSETKPSNAVKTLVTSEKPITTNTTANPTATVSQPHFDSHCDADNFVAQHASWDAAPPDEVCADVCARLSVRMVPSVLQSVPSVAEVVAGKRALILGDSPVAQTLNHKLRQLHCDTLVMSNSTDAEALCEQVSSAAQSAPFDHLFVLTAWDDQNSVANSIDAAFAETTWARERQLHVMTPYRVAQAWYGQLAPQRHDGMYWFITATRMGGDCGLSGDTPQHHGGAQTGLAKAIFLERRVNVGPDLQAAAIDFANSSPLDASAVDQICEQMLQELTRSAVDLEVAYNGEQRRVLRMLNAPLTTSPSSADRNPSAGDLSALPLSAATGCWLITGGARGVTAEIAKGLGNAMRQALQRAGKSQQPGMLHLIGSSPQPDVPAAWLDYDDSQKLELRNTIVREALANKQEKPADAWSRVEKAIEVARSLREMERQGLRVQYHSCDIANRNKLAGLLDSIRAAGEPIVGVVHGAGFEKACRFVAKQIPLVEKTVAAKVDGAALLMQLTAQDPLHSFIAFGSISGRFGAVGQTDYAMANEWLVKLVARYRVLRPEVHAVSLDWHSWADVGMAARPETKHAKLLAKLRFMPTDEGVRHFLQEVSQQSAEREVVITDWRYYKLRFPSHGVIPPVTPTPVSRVDEQHDAQPSSASSPSSLLTQADQKLCKRYVLRLQPIAAPQTNRSWLGPALIVGDNPTARSLQTLLQQQGVSVTLFAPRKASANGDITTSLAQLQQLLAERWYPHLFLVTANDVDACLLPGWKPYQERRTWGVQFPYQAIRAWMQASHTHRARQGGSLVASLNLHGDFGFHARPAAPESGALTGVLKSLRLEANRHDWSDLVVKAVDSAPDTTALSIARQLVAEALSHEDLVEVAYASEQRFSPAIQEAPLPSRQGTPSWITPGGNWLAIGGARGITGATALRLAQRLGVTMHLIGRQPLQPLPEAWLRLDASGRDQLKKQIAADAIAAGETPSSRWKQIAQQLEMQDNLRRFQTLGLRATYHAIDTADPLAWEQLLQSLRAQYGPIHGVIQGAGARNSGVIEKKSDVALQQMLAAKQDITQLLFELLRPDPLECFIGFGSVTGRLGGNGGTDYALGADMICKQIGWLRADRPNVHAVSFHWHGWGEVGMMVDPAGFGARSVSNVSLMSPDEGADHILAELNAGTPESEVLITDDSYLSVVRENGVKLLELPSNNTNTYPLPLDPSVIQAEIGSLAVQITLDPQSHSFLSQHLFRGRPLLPMVAMVEGVLQAASCSGLLKADQTYELADFQIERGLKFLQSDPITVRVLFNPTNTGYHVRLVRDFFDTKGRLLEKDQPIASCDFFPGSSAVAQHTSVLAVQPLPIDAQNWFPVEYPEHQISIYHGAPFRWLSHCRTVANHASSNARKHGANDTTLQGRLTPPQAHNDWHRTPQTPWISPLGAIDGTLFACGIAKWLEDSASVAIPSGFSRLVGSPSCPTDEELFTAVKLIDEQQLAGNGQLQAQFDAITYTKDGTVRFAIHGYTAAVLKSS